MFTHNKSALHCFPLHNFTITWWFSHLSVCSRRGRQLGHTLPPGKAQRHQLPRPDTRRPGQEYKRGTIHLHRWTSFPAQEGAAQFPAPPGWSCPAVPRHSVRHGPPQWLPGFTLWWVANVLWRNNWWSVSENFLWGFWWTCAMGGGQLQELPVQYNLLSPKFGNFLCTFHLPTARPSLCLSLL